ncbi:serine/threonine-protein kinase mos-like [Ctenocephalides felis]|uniref:serine/threonine-protein kinase mos-like n=1 Tax=Ctenocephalides felis TaxID=7515 RepID=UPI000E6E2FF8|nr:serine/threonine-protein kinase mos-like [Ctenocephalides felis]
MATRSGKLFKQTAKILSPRTSTPKFYRRPELLREAARNEYLSPNYKSPTILSDAPKSFRSSSLLSEDVTNIYNSPNRQTSPMVYTKSDRKSIRNLFHSSPLKDTSNKILNAPRIELEDTESDTNCLCFDTPKVKTSLNRLRSSSFYEYETSTQKHLLGKGSFGYVIRSRYKDMNIAAKIVRTNNSRTISSGKSERNVLQLNHPNIIKVYKIIQSFDYAIIIMELYEGCHSLKKFIGSYMDLLSDHDQYRYSYQIADALNYMHSSGIIHLDIKPANILVLDNICKVCDFGCSRQITCSENQDTYDSNNLQGTLEYIAPELLQGKIPTIKCDIYSLAILMWQMQNCCEPYKIIEPDCLIYNVVKYNLRPRSKITRRVISSSQRMYEKLYQKCWLADPAERPTAVQIMNSLQDIQNLAGLPM